MGINLGIIAVIALIINVLGLYVMFGQASRSNRVMERRREAELMLLEEVRKQALTNLSHELRTPLTAILGYVRMMLAGDLGEYDERMYDPLTSVESNARRINIIARRAILLASDSLHMSEFSLTGLVEDVVRRDDVWLATRRAPDSITLEFTSDGPAIVTADMDQVELAVFDLINNAIKFTDLGGKIHVSVFACDDWATTEVQDNGIGIEKRHHLKIFDQLYQVNMSSSRPFEGAGFGLAVVKEVAERHAGYVEVESELGKGSLFRLVIPVQSE